MVEIGREAKISCERVAERGWGAASIVETRGELDIGCTTDVGREGSSSEYMEGW